MVKVRRRVAGASVAWSWLLLVHFLEITARIDAVMSGFQQTLPSDPCLLALEHSATTDTNFLLLLAILLVLLITRYNLVSFFKAFAIRMLVGHFSFESLSQFLVDPLLVFKLFSHFFD